MNDKSFPIYGSMSYNACDSDVKCSTWYMHLFDMKLLCCIPFDTIKATYT